MKVEGRWGGLEDWDYEGGWLREEVEGGDGGRVEG